jgi:hypothetical protein
VHGSKLLTAIAILLLVALPASTPLAASEGDLGILPTWLRYYVVDINVSDTVPPTIGMTFWVPLPEVYHPNTDYGVWFSFTMRRAGEIEGRPIAVSLSYRWSMNYTTAGGGESWYVVSTMDRGSGRVVSHVAGPDGRVLRHVDLEFKVVEGDPLRKPVTYLFRAEFYGEEFEGLTLEELEEGLGELLSLEIQMALPFYTPPLPSWVEIPGYHYANMASTC